MHNRSRTSFLARLAISASLLLSSSFAWATPPGVAALSRLLSETRMGRITHVFNGPDGMTGVILEKGLNHTVAYLTPNGQYVFFGMMINLATYHNATIAEADKLIRKHHIVRLYDYLKGQFPGTATEKGNNRARYNANAARSFPMSEPLAILDLPAARIDAVMDASHAMAHLAASQTQP